MTPEEGTKPQPKITVDYTGGRWGRVFHITDPQGKEIVLGQKDATQVARQIMDIAGGEKK